MENVCGYTSHTVTLSHGHSQAHCLLCVTITNKLKTAFIYAKLVFTDCSFFYDKLNLLSHMWRIICRWATV